MLSDRFSSAEQLSGLIDAYFEFIAGEYHFEYKNEKEEKEHSTPSQKVWDREPEPATFSGLTLFLGFNSRQDFDEYEHTGSFFQILKRGRLHIEAAYEKKLHNQSSAGAIFALKSMGWNERTEDIIKDQSLKTLSVEIIETGPQPAATEREVIL